MNKLTALEQKIRSGANQAKKKGKTRKGYSEEEIAIIDKYKGPLLAFLLSIYLFELNLPREISNPSNFIILFVSIYIFFLGIKDQIYTKTSGPMFTKMIFILIVYSIFLMISAFWSPLSYESLFQGFLILITALASVYFFKVPSRYIAGQVVFAGVVFAILSFLSIVVLPQIAFQPSPSSGGAELRGIFFHQQRLGLFMTASIGFFVLAALNRDFEIAGSARLLPKHWLWIGILVVCLFESVARSYTVFMVVALAFAIMLGKPGRLRFAATAVVALSVLSAIMLQDQLLDFFTESDVDLTLSGRTNVWKRSLDLAGQQPIFGWGFASFRAEQFDRVWGLYRPPHAHNSFIQAYFDTGIVGLTMLVAFIIALGAIGVRYSTVMGRYSYSLYALALTTLASLTGTFFAGKLTFVYCLTVLIVVAEAYEMSSATRKKRTRITT